MGRNLPRCEDKTQLHVFMLHLFSHVRWLWVTSSTEIHFARGNAQAKHCVQTWTKLACYNLMSRKKVHVAVSARSANETMPHRDCHAENIVIMNHDGIAPDRLDAYRLTLDRFCSLSRSGITSLNAAAHSTVDRRHRILHSSVTLITNSRRVQSWIHGTQ